MANKLTTMYFRGPVLFAKVFEDNMDRPRGEDDAFTPKGGQFSVMVGVSDEESDSIMDLNHMYVGKDSAYYKRKQRKNPDAKIPEGFDDTKTYFTFKRRNKIYNYDGDLVKTLGAPKVVNEEGEEWDTERDGYIGNGSICDIKISVYSGVSKAGSDFNRVTLEGVRVVDLISYTPPEREEIIEEEYVSDGAIPF